MEIIKKVFGELQNNVYIVYDSKTLEGYVIDPGYEAKKLADIIKKEKTENKRHHTHALSLRSCGSVL